MDDILKKFKALSFKEQLGIYAGLVLLIGLFLPFYDWSIVTWTVRTSSLGFLVWIGGAVGAVCIFLKQEFFASVAFAAAALGVVWAAVAGPGSIYGGSSLAWGAFILMAAAAVGVWATVDALIKKIKEKQS